MASKEPSRSSEAFSALLASARRRSSGAKSASSSARPAPPRTWSRATSISPASPSRGVTEGRNTEAVSPRARERTKRPTAWAKNSGVEAEVAYTPTARRGTSTPSETMRTATIQRSWLAAKVSMRLEAPASSDRTTVGACPVMARSRPA